MLLTWKYPLEPISQMINELLRIQILSKHTLLDQVLLLLEKERIKSGGYYIPIPTVKLVVSAKFNPKWILRIIITIKATIYLYKIYIKRTYIKHL